METVESINKVKKKKHNGKFARFFLSVVLLAVISVIARRSDYK